MRCKACNRMIPFKKRKVVIETNKKGWYEEKEYKEIEEVLCDDCIDKANSNVDTRYSDKQEPGYYEDYHEI